MKIFKFDPKTGKRGEQINNLKRIDWTGCGIDYLIQHKQMKKIDYKKPADSATAEWICHENAGKTDVTNGGLKEVSYLTDEWICFCSGKYDEVWSWAILPPKNEIHYNEDMAIFR